MGINDICDLLRQEFYHNYEYGFYLDGEKYKPILKKDLIKSFLLCCRPPILFKILQKR